MNLADFLTEGYSIVVAVLYIIGMFIKETDFVKDKYIPILLMILGILSTISIAYSSSEVILPDAIFQGIICAGIAVLGNQTLKQLMKEE